jgi:hypothetical protein
MIDTDEASPIGSEAQEELDRLKREIDQVEDFDRKVGLEETLEQLVSLVESQIDILERKLSNAPSPAPTPSQKEARESLRRVQEEIHEDGTK